MRRESDVAFDLRETATRSWPRPPALAPKASSTQSCRRPARPGDHAADANLARIDGAAAVRGRGYLDLSMAIGPRAADGGRGRRRADGPLVFATNFENLTTPPPGGEETIETVHVNLTGEIGETIDIVDRGMTMAERSPK